MWSHVVMWSWTTEHQKAFDELKEKLVNVSGLGVPNVEGEIILVTDASNIGGGGSLFQWQPPSDGATFGVNPGRNFEAHFWRELQVGAIRTF